MEWQELAMKANRAGSLCFVPEHIFKEEWNVLIEMSLFNNTDDYGFASDNRHDSESG